MSSFVYPIGEHRYPRPQLMGDGDYTMVMWVPDLDNPQLKQELEGAVNALPLHQVSCIGNQGQRYVRFTNRKALDQFITLKKEHYPDVRYGVAKGDDGLYRCVVILVVIDTLNLIDAQPYVVELDLEWGYPESQIGKLLSETPFGSDACISRLIAKKYPDFLIRESEDPTDNTLGIAFYYVQWRP